MTSSAAQEELWRRVSAEEYHAHIAQFKQTESVEASIHADDRDCYVLAIDEHGNRERIAYCDPYSKDYQVCTR